MPKPFWKLRAQVLFQILGVINNELKKNGVPEELNYIAHT